MAFDFDRKAVGIWMQSDKGSPVRVFATYEALAAIDPTQMRDSAGARTTFDDYRLDIEKVASEKYDRGGVEPYTHEGQQVVMLRDVDIMHFAGQMPSKTAEQIEQECLRLLRTNMFTREIEQVGIIRTQPTGSGPNWTYGEIHPEPTTVGRGEADEIIASVAGRWALADGE